MSEEHRRVGALTQQDLLPLAKAILKLLHGGQIDLVELSGERCARLATDESVFVVREKDWRKILPHLRDGDFDTDIYPTSVLLSKILGTLLALFPKSSPTSKI